MQRAVEHPGISRSPSTEVAVIQVGQNTFGHPHPRVVESLKSIGASVLRTDLDGTVRIVTDGRRLLVIGLGGTKSE
jgi:competence protein ComEC